MKSRNLILLIVAAVVLVTIAITTSNKTNRTSSEDSTGLVLADLPVNDISKVVMSSNEGTLTLEKVAGTWICRERFDHPIKFDQLSEMVVSLSEMKMPVPVDADESIKAELKMFMPPDQNAGTVLSLYESNGNKLASILFGALRMHRSDPEAGIPEQPEGQYISLDGGKTVMLIADTIKYMRPLYTPWMNRDIMNVSPKQVERISIKRPDEKEVIFTKDDEGFLVMHGLSKNEELNPSSFRRVDAALSRLECEDIANPSMSDEELGMDNPIVFSIETGKGRIYTTRLGAKVNEKGSHYMRLSASARPPKQKPTTEETDAEKDALDQSQLEADVKAFNRRFSQWTYVVSAYTTDSMTPTREILVRKIKKTKDKE